MSKPNQPTMPEGSQQTAKTAQSSAAQEAAVLPETKATTEFWTSFKSDTDKLNDKYKLLGKLNAALENYLENPKAYLTEIGSVTSTINDLKKEIAQLETELRKEDDKKIPVRVLYDNQSIIATSTVRRKPDNYAFMEIPKKDERKYSGK